jgi:F-box-like
MAIETLPMPTASPLDNLPLEILYHIFSFLADDALTLLHVSRKFRTAAQKSKFWLDQDFAFENLIFDADPGRYYDQVAAAQVTGLCIALFNDVDFADYLQSQKSKWKFITYGAFMAAITSLPSFRRNARHLHFVEPMDRTMARLVDFANVEEVLISFNTLLNFSLPRFVQDMPIRVKRLFIDFHLTSRSFVGGTLARLRGLEELDTRGWSIGNGFLSQDDVVRSEMTRTFMPFASSETLTRLTLEGDNSMYVSINDFPNLKHLRTTGMSGPIPLSPALDHFQGRLETLCTQLIMDLDSLDQADGRVEYWPHWRVFRLNGLAHLRVLHLDVLGSDMWASKSLYVHFCMICAEEIVNCMPKLEDIGLWAGLDVRHAHCMSRLSKLKTLQWNVESEDEIEGRHSKDEDLNSYFLDPFGRFESAAAVSVRIGKFDRDPLRRGVLIDGKRPFEWP